MFARGFKAWCEQVALQQRKNLGLLETDPLEPHLLAKNLNVQVWKADDVPTLAPEHLHTLLVKDPDSWSAVTILVGTRPLIVLNSAHSKARQASDLTHELSHLIIGHKAARLDVSPDGLLILHSFDRQQEDEANWLSGCLLLPRPALLLIRRRKMKDADVQGKYGVSSAMLQYRINVSGVDYQIGRARTSKR
jgi:hypothetical protein